MLSNSGKKIWQKWHIAFQILPFIILIGVAKWLVNRYDYDIFELNALFTSLVAGTIFLIGFLISGVLTDYKESEKLPAELAGILRNLRDDTWTIYQSKNSPTARRFLDYQREFVVSLSDWLYKKDKTAVVVKKISDMNTFFAELDKEGIQPNYLIKMKNEQNNMRKTIMRIQTIRDTSFVGSAYAIVEAMAVLITFGLIMIRIEPFYASLFITVLVNFLIFYMLLLIKDLDNPFDYSSKGEKGTEVTLRPIRELQDEMKDQ